jgi:hypothetical protein
MSRDYYVYGWFNNDWGVYFYIGRGKGDRYKNTHNRSKAFKTVVSRWNCEPIILKDGLTLEEAEFLEQNRKEYLLFTAGHPIIDGEPRNMRATAVANGIAAMPVDENGRRVSAKTGRAIGRERKCPTNFEEVYARQQRGEITLREAFELTGVHRTRWYELARELTKQKQII